MRITRVFVDLPLACGQAVRLPAPAAHHLVKVLRMGPGDAVQVFNGTGGCFEAVLRDVGRRDAVLEPMRQLDAERESSLTVTLVQGVSRAQRMDHALQKAVELGVQRIVPVLCDRGGVRLDEQRGAGRREHWRGILIGACEQSGRNRVPELLDLCAARDWFAVDTNADRLILDPRGALRLRNVQPGGASVSLACGPEGGFSDEELETAARHGWRAVQLGPRVLRTETAAVAALAACQALWGDLA
jgi:16S rRNA (uracil1498-N3)-methyltransferase